MAVSVEEGYRWAPAGSPRHDTVNGKYPERGVDITLTQTMLSSLLEHLEQLKNDHKSLK